MKAWGPWTYDSKVGVLVCQIPGFPKHSTYEIDLDRCQTSAAKCDWLAQIAEKTWGTLEVLGTLVQALDAVVGLRPQAGRAAAVEAEPSAATWLRMVLRVLRDKGPLTDEQMQDLLDLNPSTQRPRRVDLVRRGLVEDSGARRPTKSGRMAVVWRAI